MRTGILTALFFIGSLGVAACDKSDTKAAPAGSAAAADAKGDTKAASDKPAAPTITKLDKLELSFEAKGEISQSDMSSMSNTPAAMISIMDVNGPEGAKSVSLNVSLAKDTDPKTVEQGKGAMIATENQKTEKLADGWLVTAENTGSAGRNYELNMRREIGGKGYLCTTMQSSEAQRQAAIAICKSLKK
jgi:hypothetical protein